MPHHPAHVRNVMPLYSLTPRDKCVRGPLLFNCHDANSSRCVLSPSEFGCLSCVEGLDLRFFVFLGLFRRHGHQSALDIWSVLQRMGHSRGFGSSSFGDLPHGLHGHSHSKCVDSRRQHSHAEARVSARALEGRRRRFEEGPTDVQGDRAEDIPPSWSSRASDLPGATVTLSSAPHCNRCFSTVPASSHWTPPESQVFWCPCVSKPALHTWRSSRGHRLTQRSAPTGIHTRNTHANLVPNHSQDTCSAHSSISRSISKRT